MSRDGKVMSVAVTPGPETDFGLPRELFQTPLQSPLLITAQDRHWQRAAIPLGRPSQNHDAAHQVVLD